MATQPNIGAYLVGGSAQGPVFELRGHSAVFARICLWLGILATPAVGYVIHGFAQDPGEELAIVITVFVVLAWLGLVFGSLWRLRHPDRKLIIDRDAQAMAVWSHGEERQRLSFDQLGPMKLRSRTLMVHRDTGERAKKQQAYVGLSDHPDVQLFYPDTEGDMVRFVVTLRHIVGERYLPKATPKSD